MDAIFRVDGNRVLTSPDAAGPWDPGMQHGSAPASLVVWAAEAIPTPVPMRIARVTIDLMRPVPVAPLTLETEVLREGPLGQGLAYRRVEPLADGFADTFPYRLGHALMDGFGEALAQPLAGAIEVESVRSTLRLDECRADLLSQPLAKLIPYSLLDRVVQTIAYPFGHAFP